MFLSQLRPSMAQYLALDPSVNGSLLSKACLLICCRQMISMHAKKEVPPSAPTPAEPALLVRPPLCADRGEGGTQEHVGHLFNTCFSAASYFACTTPPATLTASEPFPTQVSMLPSPCFVQFHSPHIEDIISNLAKKAVQHVEAAVHSGVSCGPASPVDY